MHASFALFYFCLEAFGVSSTVVEGTRVLQSVRYAACWLERTERISYFLTYAS